MPHGLPDKIDVFGKEHLVLTPPREFQNVAVTSINDRAYNWEAAGKVNPATTQKEVTDRAGYIALSLTRWLRIERKNDTEYSVSIYGYQEDLLESPADEDRGWLKNMGLRFSRKLKPSSMGADEDLNKKLAVGVSEHTGVDKGSCLMVLELKQLAFAINEAMSLVSGTKRYTAEQHKTVADDAKRIEDRASGGDRKHKIEIHINDAPFQYSHYGKAFVPIAEDAAHFTENANTGEKLQPMYFAPAKDFDGKAIDKNVFEAKFRLDNNLCVSVIKDAVDNQYYLSFFHIHEQPSIDASRRQASFMVTPDSSKMAGASPEGSPGSFLQNKGYRIQGPFTSLKQVSVIISIALSVVRGDVQQAELRFAEHKPDLVIALG